MRRARPRFVIAARTAPYPRIVDWIVELRDRVWPTATITSDTRLLIAALALAFAGVAIPPVWQMLRTGVTLVHEFGHAVIGVVCGRRFTGFVVRGDMSGETVTVGPARGFGVILTTWAGYPAPALFGAGLVAAAAYGWASIMLTVVLVVLVFSLIRIRSVYTALVMLTVLAGVGALWWWRLDLLQVAVLMATGAFLIMGAWRQCWTVARSTHRGSDPARLATLTRLPRLLWLATFWLVIAAATALAALAMASASGWVSQVTSLPPQ